MNDEERGAFYGLPEGCRVREGAKIFSPEKFECGKNVWIGENAIIDATSGLSIGDHTSIGLSVMIWSHTTFLANLTMQNVIATPLMIKKKTKIGKGCFIAGPSVIYHGVTIGDRVMVLPMSVVTKDVPSDSMVGGAPAKVIKKITKEFIEEQLKKVRNE
jgi:acetyltransferase-like isoleucine patch superfamily enzyme